MSFMKSILAGLLMVGAVSATGVPVSPSFVEDAHFQDPYGGTTILSVELLSCLSIPQLVDPTKGNLQVQVTIPGMVNAGGDDVNAYFGGGAFSRTFAAFSIFLGIPVPSSVTMAYDGVSTITFSGFSASAVSNNPSLLLPPGWVSINVDINDSSFVGGIMSLVPIQSTTSPLTVNLSNPADFTVFADFSLCGPGGLGGDPQFAGFQGQNFQFHGMADEVFNLISTPTFQMNGNFKYLSSGKCDYNETVCYTHPGTYVDQLGFVIGDISVKAVAGPHDLGLRLWMNDVEITQASTVQNKIIFSYWNSSEETGSVKFSQKSKFTVDVPQFRIEVTNSDYFFNLEVSLKDAAILRAGSKRTSSHTKFLCSATGMKSSDRLVAVEDEMSKHYPRVPIHGLIGQTWRNAMICDHAWVGDASDYVTSSLYAYDSAFNYYGTL